MNRIVSIFGEATLAERMAAAFPADRVVRGPSPQAEVVVVALGKAMPFVPEDVQAAWSRVHPAPRSVVLVRSVASDERDGALAALREAVARARSRVCVNALAIVGIDEVKDAWLEALRYLAGHAAPWTTGQCLVVDGALARASKAPVSFPTAQADDVVVVGMGLAVPGASSPQAFWELLRQGMPVFGEPGARWDIQDVWSPDPQTPDRTYSRVSGFMKAFQPHPSLHGKEKEPHELTAFWLRHCIAQASESVSIRPHDRHVLAVGLTVDGSHHLEQSLVLREVRRHLPHRDEALDARLRELYPLAVDEPAQVLPYSIARQAAVDLPSDTEIVVLDTACSSALYGIDVGVRALRAGEADVALCGGAFALSINNLVLFSKLRGLSRSGAVRPLDGAADGVLFSDGAALLALKTYARASADGDRILGFITGFGGSSDGRGKAIYAPNPAGQRIALRRAWSAAHVTPDDVDWVIAHATGTPTGDRTELSVLAAFRGEREESQGKVWTVSSNKGIFGHTGWAAGAVSAVHALMALQHGIIPAQAGFEELPKGLDATGFTVPRTDIPWPAQEQKSRTVGVSAMGFGGTNAHLVISDAPPRRASSPRALPNDPIVCVAWSAHLPGEPGNDAVEQWLSGAKPAWPAAFGEHYPMPSAVHLRLAPTAIEAMDRSQLMAVRCADMLTEKRPLAPEWTDRCGVFVGHSGATRAAVRHDMRCYLAGLATHLGAAIPEFEQRLTAPIQQAIPAAKEDSYPGIMPNIIAARIAQRLDLHGPNMTLDAGLDSFASALLTSARSLRDREIDVALALGVSAAAEHAKVHEGRESAEAAVGVMLTRESFAREHALPILARVDLDRAAQGKSTRRASVSDPRVYHGAEGAVAFLRAMHDPHRASTLLPWEDAHTPAIVITPAASVIKLNGPSLAQVMQRYQLALRPAPARTVRGASAAIPPNSVVICDDFAVLPRGAMPESCLCVRLGTGSVAEQVAASGQTFRHVRIVLSGTAASDEVGFQRVLAVNDAAFGAAQACAAALQEGGSMGMLLLDAFAGDVPRPAVGLFGGMARSLERELLGAHIFVLATDTRDMSQGLSELTEESALHRYLPIAYRQGGRRLELRLEPTAPAADEARGLGIDEPVVVASGGARGLTATLVRELLSGSRPRAVWLLGTGPALASDAPTSVPTKAQAIREWMQQSPNEKPAALNRRYETAVRDAERARTIQEMQRRWGPDRVHYRTCDVQDAEAVHRVIDEIVATHGRVDVVVHGAGLVRSAALARKSLADYRFVRDVKVLGDRYLRSALAKHSQPSNPMPSLWCSLSSVGAILGMRGEADYDAGNEYIQLAAANARAEGRDEVALMSGLWVESGLAAKYVTGDPLKSGLADYTQLTDAQGTEFFRTELAGRRPSGLGTTWLGEREWTALHVKAPGLREASIASSAMQNAASARHVAPPSVFLPEQPESREGDGRKATWRFQLGLDRHPWLLHHLVDERPTVPGTFLMAMAVEAANRLAPRQIPVRITDLVLSRFLRAPLSHWPRPIVITASQEAQEAGCVHVTIASPPQGAVPSQEYTRMKVWFAEARAPRERLPSAPQPTQTIEVPDVYRLNGPVSLSGVFANMGRVSLHEDGGSASLALPPIDAPLDGLPIPSIALDALLRTVILDGRRPASLALVVPTAIALVELLELGSDKAWREHWGDGVTLRHWSGSAGGQCAAIAPNGTVLLRMSGISTAVRATYEREQKRWTRPMLRSSA
ncbi:SDR family oxidoreductase [Pendulispora brunnea]|uniref:SDR family oxidoreductase n=1 Tax=Pendulispora brunnea TaxID=2905690 RepID=A0ABZ2K0N3_9BACT